MKHRRLQRQRRMLELQHPTMLIAAIYFKVQRRTASLPLLVPKASLRMQMQAQAFRVAEKALLLASAFVKQPLEERLTTPLELSMLVQKRRRLPMV